MHHSLGLRRQYFRPKYPKILIWSIFAPNSAETKKDFWENTKTKSFVITLSPPSKIILYIIINWKFYLCRTIPRFYNKKRTFIRLPVFIFPILFLSGRCKTSFDRQPLTAIQLQYVSRSLLIKLLCFFTFLSFFSIAAVPPRKRFKVKSYRPAIEFKMWSDAL